MKRKLFPYFLFVSTILASSVVLADTDKEITFRDIPWGTSYAEVQQILNEFDWYDMSFDIMRHYPVEEVITDDYDYYSYDFKNGGINMTAQPFTNKETSVAGYTTSDIELFFAYTPVDGILTKEDSASALYGARYEFEPQNLSEMMSDLKGKLSSLYGEPDDQKEDTDFWGNKTTIIYWKGHNDTVVALRGMDSSGDTSNLYDDELWIVYAWEKGDDLLSAADKAVSSVNSAIEASSYGNDDTGGL